MEISPTNQALRLPTLREAIMTLSVEFLWRFFELPGDPAASCLSPFRSEMNPSFSVFVGQEGKSRFNDFGDPDIHGDSFDFYQLCTGQSGKEAREAFCVLAAKVRDGGINIPHDVDGTTRTARARRPLSDRERQRMRDAAFLLTLLPARQKEIAERRGWQVETIARLAAEESLGLAQRRLAFIYQTGMKLRWDTGGKRQISWLFGNASSPWRQHRLETASTVYVTEGETDAITIIDEGIESDEKIAVVALPSASALCFDSIPLFKGKEVILCFDADKAGSDATEKFGTLLKPVAKNIKHLDLEAALQ